MSRPLVAHMGRVQTFEQHAPLNGLGLTMDYGSPAPRPAPSTAEPEVRIFDIPASLAGDNLE